MEDKEIEEIFNKYREQIRNIKQFYYSTDNIFKILHQETYENKHSIFLSWLFNPDANHGLKEKFAQELFDRVFGKNEINLANEKIENVIIEKRTNGKKEKKEKKDKKRIDILIVGSNFTCTIENKYGSRTHDNQCTNYKNYINENYANKKNKFIFLDIYSPKDFDENHESDYANYDFISYQTIRDILNELLIKNEQLKTDAYSKQKIFIEQYKQILDELYGDNDTDTIARIKELCEPIKFQDVLSLWNITDDQYENLEFDEKIFVDTVNKYYQIMKNENDKIIFECLKNICQDKDFFKSDYGQKKEMYAHTIPVLLDFLSSSFLPDYLYKAQSLLDNNHDNQLITEEEKITEADKKRYKTIKAKREQIKKESDRFEYLKSKKRKDKEDKEYEQLKAKREQNEKEEKQYKELTERIERTAEEEAMFQELKIKKEQKQKEEEEYISLDKKIKKIKKTLEDYKGINNRKIDEIPFQTIDYVGPSAECEHIKIDILAGYKPKYSKFICNHFTEEQAKLIFSLENWNRSFLFYIRNGSGSFISIKELDNVKGMAKKELKVENPKELLNVLNKLKEFYLANGKKISFALSKNEEKNEEELNKLLSYFKDFKFKDSNISMKKLLSEIISSNKYEEILIGCAIDLAYEIKEIDLNEIDKENLKQKLQEILYTKTIKGTEVYNYHKWFEDTIFIKDLKKQYLTKE